MTDGEARSTKTVETRGQESLFEGREGVAGELAAEFPHLWDLADQADRNERLDFTVTTEQAEAAGAMRELWMSRAASRVSSQPPRNDGSALGKDRQDARAVESLFAFLPWRVEKRGLDVSAVISDAEGCDQARIFDRDVGEAIVRAVNGYETALGLLREATLVSSDGWDALDARMRKFLEAELGY